MVLAPLFRTLLGRRLTPLQLRLAAQALYGSVELSREYHYELGRDFYLDERARAGFDNPPSSVRNVRPSFYEPESLQKSVERTLSPTPKRPTVDLAALDEATKDILRHVEDASRNVVRDMSLEDPVAVAWARRPTGRETCAFCRMLVSRGPVYKSRETAYFQAHNGCDCQAVPIFDRSEKDWPGYEDYLSARKDWNDATKNKSGTDALSSFRRFYYALESGESREVALERAHETS